MDTKDQFKRKVFLTQYCELSPERKAQFREVAYSKLKLASKSITCPIKSLENGLLSPDIPELSPIKPFPEGGERLIKRPLYQAEKPKKKIRRKKTTKK